MLNFTINYDENITLNTTLGTPTLRIVIGSTTIETTFTGATANGLNFAYTVVSGDMDMDGIAIGTLQLNSSTIRDAAGNNANNTLNSIGNTSGVFVNTVIPSVTLSNNGRANLCECAIYSYHYI